MNIKKIWKTVGVLSAVCLMGAQATQTWAANDKPVIAGIVFQQDIYMKTVLAGMRAAAKEGKAQLLEARATTEPAASWKTHRWAHKSKWWLSKTHGCPKRPWPWQVIC